MVFRIFRKSEGLLYALLQPLSVWMLRGHFRRVYVGDMEKIALDQPVLIAANHPTAFLDPIVMANVIHTPLYNMTRGDLFAKPWANKILNSINMFPVFRHKDGFYDQDRNDPVFEYCKTKMSRSQVVTIFVEGQHCAEKRVFPCKKGIARIAFGAYEQQRNDALQILPMGCSYWQSDQPRNVGYLMAGDPIFVKDYWDAYLENPNHTIRKLCADIEAAIKGLAYHIENRADDDLAEHLLTMYRSEHTIGYLPVISRNKSHFTGEKNLLNALNALGSDEKESVARQVNHYFESLQKAGVTDEGLLDRRWNHPGVWLFLLIGLPFFMAGYFLNLPAWQIAKRIVGQKVKKREFRSSVWVGIQFTAGLLTTILFTVAAVTIWGRIGLIIGLLCPYLCWFSMIYAQVYSDFKAGWKARFSPSRKQLLAARKKISPVDALLAPQLISNEA